MIKQMQRTTTKMFKNILLGGKGVGRYFKVKNKRELLDLLDDFTKHFKKCEIKAPTLSDIAREARLHVHSFIDSDQVKSNLLLRIQSITGEQIV